MNNPKDEIEPFFVYGTAWKEEKTESLTEMALQAGFRAIDTANQRKHYFEEGVGNGIANFLDGTDYQREDLFIQTKFTYKQGQDNRLPYDPKADFADQVRQSFESSLDHLQTDYLDSYILHGPSTRQGLLNQDYEVWETIESLKKERLTKYIGVSNISTQQLELIIEEGEIKPDFVQNRCFARTGWDQSTRNLCTANDIIYQGFSLLTANQNYLEQSEINTIAKKYDLPITSIVFAFATQIGMLPLTGTTNKDHMNEDLSAIEHELSADDIHVIENIAF